MSLQSAFKIGIILITCSWLTASCGEGDDVVIKHDAHKPVARPQNPDRNPQEPDEEQQNPVDYDQFPDIRDQFGDTVVMTVNPCRIISEDYLAQLYKVTRCAFIQDKVPADAITLNKSQTIGYRFENHKTELYFYSPYTHIIMPEECDNIFSRMLAPEIEGFERLDFSHCTNMSSTFAYSEIEHLDLSGMDTHLVTSMAFMFNNCNRLKQLDLRSFDTKQVTDMQGMFVGLDSLTVLDITSFDTRNVEWMTFMFYSFGRHTSGADIYMSESFVVPEEWWRIENMFDNSAPLVLHGIKKSVFDFMNKYSEDAGWKISREE